MATVGSLSVFCGSSSGINGRHREAAAALGTILAEEGVELVFGGARIGLMGVLADAALEADGRVCPDRELLMAVGLHEFDKVHVRLQRRMGRSGRQRPTVRVYLRTGGPAFPR